MRQEREQYLSTLTFDGKTRIKDLARLEPIHLQQQLALIHQSMPARTVFPRNLADDNAFNRQNEIGKGRVNSPDFTKAATWLEALLNVSPTTCGFDFYLMRQFWQAYRIGIDPSQDSDELSIIVNSDGAKQGGFFNPTQVPDYERWHYREFLEKELEIERLWHDTASRVMGEEDVNDFIRKELEARNWSLEETQAEIEKLNRILSEELGASIDIQNLYQLMRQDFEKKRQQQYGRRWIEPIYQVYTKGPRIEKPYALLPIQEVDESSLLLARWRQDFMDKYKDEI